MDDRLTYKGYTAELEVDVDAGVIAGSVIDLRDMIVFYGATVEETIQAFHRAVDDYLEFCKEKGRDPEKPYSGRILFRTSAEKHHDIAVAARLSSAPSLNAWMEQVLVAAAEAARKPQPEKVELIVTEFATSAHRWDLWKGAPPARVAADAKITPPVRVAAAVDKYPWAITADRPLVIMPFDTSNDVVVRTGQGEEQHLQIKELAEQLAQAADQGRIQVAGEQVGRVGPLIFDPSENTIIVHMSGHGSPAGEEASSAGSNVLERGAAEDSTSP